MRKIKLDSLERRVKERLISKQELGDLVIYNYSQICQFGKKWDKWTRMARGLIVKKDGTIIARPYPKFFNLGEKLTIKDLPPYQPEISEKLDGSLGILYWNGKEHVISTRGCFDSDQAVWATKWLKAQGKKDFKENITYLFEIIFPENRVVVDYKGRAELVMIGMVHIDTGKIFPYQEVIKEAKRLGFSHPQMFEVNLEAIQERAEKEKNGTEQEGFVLFYPKENLLLKIKLRDYVRLHRLVFGISVKAIWENLMEGKNPYDIFKDAPDEVMGWLSKWTEKFKNNFYVKMAKVEEAIEKVKVMPDRKSQALWMKKNCFDLLPMVFAKLDNKDWEKVVWKTLRPKSEDAIRSFKIVKEDI